MSRRAGSSFSFHGSWSERYLLARPTTRIASPMAGLNRRAAQQLARPCRTRSRDAVQQRAVAVGQLAGRRDRADVLVRHRDRAVDQVAPLVGQLEVGAADELVPGEVGVLVLRAGHRDEVAQRVRPELARGSRRRRSRAARAGQLRARHRQELRADTISVGRSQLAERGRASPPRVALAVGAEQDARPDDRVEDDVVLAHEVVRPAPRRSSTTRATRPGRRTGAPTRPRPTGSRSPRRTRRRCASSGRRASRRAGIGHAPVEVAGDRARLQISASRLLAELQTRSDASRSRCRSHCPQRSAQGRAGRGRSARSRRTPASRR